MIMLSRESFNSCQGEIMGHQINLWSDHLILNKVEDEIKLFSNIH
jgi:hypothetical protein